MISFANKVENFPETSYCYNVERIPRPSGGTIVKMYCPVLMSGMGNGHSSSSVSFNGSKCFINDTACKPTVPSSVKLQNYIQFTCEYNSSFSHLVDITDHIPAYTRFQCYLTNGLPITRSFSTDM